MKTSDDGENRYMLRGAFVFVLSLLVNSCLSASEPQPKLTRGPYLQAATTESIIIRWRTDALERGVVRYGTENGKLSQVQEGVLTTEHIIKISGLKPSTKYFYSIGGLTHTLQGDKDNYFYTLPQPGSKEKIRIAALGDCGNNSENQKQIRDQVLRYMGDSYLNAWILLGDNAYESGTDAEFGANFFAPFKDDILKRYALFPTPGNHDYRDIDKYRGKSQQSQDIAYYKVFSMPVNGESGGVASNNAAYYSFDVGNVHFLSLDSYGKDADGNRMYDTLSPQVQWVKKDLEENKNKDWVVAYWHHPPFTMSSHNSDKETELVKIRENFIRILERNGVDVVLCGHSHGYERSWLMNGHYGREESFDAAAHVIDGSTAKYDGSSNSCPYVKSESGKGIVYVVAGSAGKLDTNVQKTYPHDAMVYSNSKVGGGLILEAENNRLDVKWLCADGVIRDQFTMMKNVNRRTPLRMKKGEKITLAASYTGVYNWSHSNEKTKSVSIVPKVGKTVYTVRDQFNCVHNQFEVIVEK